MKQYAIGIDVGGTKLAAGMVNSMGEVVAFQKSATLSEQKPVYVIEAICQIYNALLEETGCKPSDIKGVGLGFAGTVNGPAGLIYISSNLPEWDHMPLRDEIAERLGLPVILDNDANVFAVAEHRYGAGVGTSNMCYVCFSTGVGLGIIIEGKLYKGHTGTAGEFGHMVVEKDGYACTCGKQGCLLTYASGIGISRIVYEKIDQGEQTILKKYATQDRRRISGEVVAEAARTGDQVAVETLETAGFYFGLGLSAITQMINPELIVIGG
ncbi:MAG: ROK family protein, partial [Pelolinea sp.]|nr:ROK family protein [Pelolinea sp.]